MKEIQQSIQCCPRSIEAGRLLPVQATELKHQDSRIDSGHTPAVVRNPTLYHAGGLTKLSAECAWQAGHCGLNTVWVADDCDMRQHIYIDGTPLWTVSNQNWFDTSPIETFNWLVEHGGEPFWIHPTYLTAPAHKITRVATQRSIYRGYVLEDLERYLLSKVCDKCRCYCSKDGCHVIACVIGRFIRLRYRNYRKRLFSLVKGEPYTIWIGSAALRVLTFEKLSLTHTCCYQIENETRGIFTRPTTEEAEEIYDLELLEEVVAKMEERWAGYKRFFVTFVNRVWRPRMRKIRRDRQVNKATYQTESVRMSIALEDPTEDVDSDSDSDEDWPEESEDADSDGWYTTDEEGEEWTQDCNEGEPNARGYEALTEVSGGNATAS